MNRQELEHELRGALEEEVAYLKRTQAERTASAVGGTRLQHVATLVLYAFSLEREFLVPDDSRVVARVGHELLRGVVISVRGMELTLGLERDLGPTIARVEISVDATAVLERVLARLQEAALSALPDGFARRVFGLERAHLSSVEVRSKVSLSSNKQEALKRAVGSEVLFVWGPPGTGKTQAIAALCEVFVEREESVLLTSHTNVAVDEAIWRAAGSEGPLYETPAYFERKLVRYGPTDHPHLTGVAELQAEAVAERLGAELKRQLEEVSARLDQIARDRKRLGDALQAWNSADRADEEAESKQRALDDVREALAACRAEYLLVAKAVLGTEADPGVVRAELQRKLDDVWAQLAQMAHDRKRLREALEAWRTAERAAEDAEAKERALDGARAALPKRQREHRHCTEEVASARHELDSVLNPRGLRRLFRKDPAPFEQAIRRATAPESRARQALASAVRWEARARLEAQNARLEAERLATIPSLAKADALSRDGELEREEAQLEQLREGVEQAALREKQAREELEVVVLWETRARSEAEIAQQEADRLAAVPSVPKHEALRQDQELESEATRLEQQRTQLDQELSSLLKKVIQEATFVATTLTRAGVDDNVCRRSFDNVIVDEASMAPMPLVYLVSLAARKRVILVGDFRQLPPIVQAPERDAPLAAKWLGRDIFQQVGIGDLDLPGDKAALRADLWEQHRMAPEIREFVSARFYGGMLRDADSGTRRDDAFWAARKPVGAAVSMVDTTSLGAWSQRSPGTRPSKFNVYSALVAVELAETLLHGLEQPEDGMRRVGIITPYRAQANLLRVLVEGKGLDKLVRAGTVHSFQGTENDVIIFDYVEDTPNWKAGPLLLDQGPRLMNVAVTRARHRLFVLGSYAHARQHLRRSKLWDLVDYSARMHRIMAGDFLREDFHKAVAEAKARISHGQVSDLDTTELRVCSERDFFAALDYDLARAQSSAVLFAAFLGHRVEEVVPRLIDCVQRGVDVYVVTPPLSDQKAGLRSWYAPIHSRLESLGVRLVFFRQMHQKLVFIDDHILYVGSLNPLSHVDTLETMDRWDSKAVFDAHAEQVRLKDLLSVWDDPDDMAMRTCPRDGSPLLVVAPVTYQDYDPMFWACSSYPDADCNYKRRFAYGPRRSGPRFCDKCGSPMRIEQKPGNDWWVCGQCRRRRKVQEGEGVQPPIAAWQPSIIGTESPTRKPEARLVPKAEPADVIVHSGAQLAGANRDSLLAQLRSKGLEVIDRRPEGGALWVSGGQDLAELLTQYGFKFAPQGSRSTRRRPAWYLPA
jgi:hypothetical protein